MLLRVCFELDLLQQRPKSVWLRCEGGFVEQPVRYKRCPKYCVQCNHLGHDVFDCRELREKEKVVPDNTPEDLRSC